MLACLGGGGVSGGLSEAGVFEGGADGVFFGETGLLWSQLIAMGSVIVFSFVMTLIIAKAIDATIGLRVDEEAESLGLDVAEHAETAYS